MAGKFKFIVSRARWARGASENYLFNPSTEKMCCLGHYGVACGIPRDAMTLVGNPYTLGDLSRDERVHELWNKLCEWHEPEGMQADPYLEPEYDNSELARGAITINDDPQMTDAERELALTILFAKWGIEVEFID